ncbi:hypothetical protein GCM10007103_17130 [Salinimicrobium marinum]|uniref:Uncharacterized protein n=1 Tax=Salinimicrobium marinum TaxID=680283 RepID=A0A918SEE4_9FLAO|nr:hypothetical protein GCM10007103_17130 [Salinimicrobium marinum]
MKIEVIIISLTLSFLFFNGIYAQEQNLQNILYTVIAEGTDSSIPNLRKVCFNKYFNKDYLPSDFQKNTT